LQLPGEGDIRCRVAPGTDCGYIFFTDTSVLQILRCDPLVRRPRAVNKLLLLGAAENENDLRMPPANHLQQMHGDGEGFHSIRINRQWRIRFRFEAGNVYDVQITDLSLEEQVHSITGIT
jgi:plasmid maintenance system killer protein